MPQSSAKPLFQPGKNIAMKVPAHEYGATVAFYRDILGLNMLETQAASTVFDFDGKNLWIDREEKISQAQIWLQIVSDDVQAAAAYLQENHIVRNDGLETLPPGLRGMWILNPANIVHLVNSE